VDVVCLFELLTGDVGQLSLGDERLRLGADEFLLKSDKLGGLWLLVLQFLDLVLNLWEMLLVRPRVCLRNWASPHLLLVSATGLHRALGVTNLLQHTPAVFESLCEQVFLLGDLRQQYPELVTDVAEGFIVGALAPLAQLAGDVGALLGRILVCADSMVLGLDELVKTLRKLGLLSAAQ